MKTTQEKALGAFRALNRMSQKSMNSFAAYKLFRLKKALSPVLEFQAEREQTLVEELGGTISETGAILIKDKDKRAEFQQKYKELSDMECEVDAEKLVMYMKELPEISLSDMDALDEFIEWKE